MLTSTLVQSSNQNKITTKTNMAQLKLALSVIVPTRNEAGNVVVLLNSIKNTFGDTCIEVIFVDDSTDQTPHVVTAAIRHFPTLNVRLIHRQPKQQSGGLGGAVIVGLNAARSEYVCVMDGDLQHPPKLIPSLLKQAKDKQVDMVIATRRCKDSECEGLSALRDLASRGLDLLGRIFFIKQLRGVSDPLTGFFLVRKRALDLKAFRPNGFKILMEILVRHPNLKKDEIPFQFGDRHSGESKASYIEVWRYFVLLWTLRFGEESFRFAGFALVGLSGVLINLIIIFGTTDFLHINYLLSAAVATIGSTLWNFALTENLVYNSKNMSQGRMKRLGLFFGMNLVALSLRTPILYVLTTVLGVYYLVSNVISLAVMTIARFVLSDGYIWRRNSNSKPTNLKPVRQLEHRNEVYVVL